MDDWRSYDLVAEIYERVHAARFAEPARDLLALAGIDAGMQVLDVGTGTGVLAEAAGAAGCAAVGIDPSIQMLGAARRARPSVPVVAATALDLPFRNGVFHIVAGNFVVAHFQRPDTALFDLVRVTRPGGRIALSAWADGADAFTDAWRELVWRIVPKELLAPSVERAVPHHDRFRDRAALETLLHDAELSHVRSEPVTYAWTYGRDEYVDGLQTWATARFVRGMLGEASWAAFMENARAEFAVRFPDPLHDRRDVLLAVGTKP